MAYTTPYGYQPGYPTYLPQQQYAQQMGGMQMPQQVPPQQMPPQPGQGAPLWVQGEAGAKSYLVAPGQSLMLMDSEAEVFYIKTTDQSGVPLPLRTFDYKERVTGTQQTAQAAQQPGEQYVTRGEYDALAAKLADVTARLDALLYAQQPQTAQEAPREHVRRRQTKEGEIDA